MVNADREDTTMDNELWRWIWTFATVAFTIGEAVTAGFFMLPFGIGAALAAIAAWFDLAGGLQWLLFFGGSAISFVIVRKYMHRQDTSDGRPAGVNRYIGMTGMVLSDVDAHANTGMVRVETDQWRATPGGSSAGQTLPEGTQVKVIGMNGNRLLVERAEGTTS